MGVKAMSGGVSSGSPKSWITKRSECDVAGGSDKTVTRFRTGRDKRSSELVGSS